MAKHPFKIEICVEGIDGLLAAQEAGADRVELCASLLEGGLTPSLGTVREALQAGDDPVPCDRPAARRRLPLFGRRVRDSMVEDVAALRDLGVAGVVVGCLTAGRRDRRGAHEGAGRGGRGRCRSPATAPST